MTSERAPDGLSLARRIAIVGNVSVGKTCLFDRLCRQGEHSVNIPGSTLSVRRGVLAIGPAAAPRAFRRRCASCRPHGSRFGRGSASPCCDITGMREQCPALEVRSTWPWRRPLISLRRSADDVEAADADSSEGARRANKPDVTHLYDTPGSASLAAGSEDEMVARDLLLSGQMDAVLLVVDAKNLRRSLALALQVAELGLPMVLALNMLDEADSMGLEIDDAELARSLAVPIARTVAVESRGIRRLAEMLLDAKTANRQVTFPDIVEEGLERLAALFDNQVVAPRALGILLMSRDRGAESWVAKHFGKEVLKDGLELVKGVQARFATPLGVIISDAFHSESARITERVVSRSRRGADMLQRFGLLAQRPWSGAAIALGVLLLAYLWVGAFGATYVVDNLSARLFGDYLVPWCERLVAPIPSEFVRAAIIDPEFGLLPSGLFLAIGLVLPVLFCFYLLQAVLEDSGYLPRLAVLFDRVFRRLGLNGQALIPLVLGFSCAAMAVITTRVLHSRKERIILTLLVVGIPCAPLLAVMVIILAKMPWTASAVVIGLIALRILVAGYLSSKLLGGEKPDLILEIPKMRIPRPRIMLAKTWRRSWHFMREAVPVFLLASFAVFLFDRVHGLAVVEQLSRPLVSNVLGLPDQAVQVFIKTAIRRENGATELNLLREHFTNVQLVVTLVVMTFVMPCINTTIVIFKERGLKVTAAILATVMISALATGAAVNLICRTLGVTLA